MCVSTKILLPLSLLPLTLTACDRLRYGIVCGGVLSPVITLTPTNHWVPLRHRQDNQISDAVTPTQ